LLPLLGREIFKVDIHEVSDFGHLESIRLVPLGVPKSVSTQKVHLAPNTQQAEQAGFARAKSNDDMPVNFS
jgi:hypothetical protein